MKIVALPCSRLFGNCLDIKLSQIIPAKNRTDNDGSNQRFLEKALFTEDDEFWFNIHTQMAKTCYFAKRIPLRSPAM